MFLIFKIFIYKLQALSGLQLFEIIYRKITNEKTIEKTDMNWTA